MDDNSEINAHALLRAAMAGDLATVKGILATQPELGKDASAGATALQGASQQNRFECLPVLLSHSDVNQLDNLDRTALHFAAATGAVECVEILAPLSDATIQSLVGGTALMAAAQAGHADCVRALLPFSDADTRNKEGDTPLTIATLLEEIEVVKALAGRCDATKIGSLGRSALMVAAGSSTHPGREDNCLEFFRVLIPHSDLRALCDGKTALDFAVETQKWAGADFLASCMSPETALALLGSAPDGVRLERCEAIAEQAQLSRVVLMASAGSHAQDGQDALSAEAQARAEKRI